MLTKEDYIKLELDSLQKTWKEEYNNLNQIDFALEMLKICIRCRNRNLISKREYREKRDIIEKYFLKIL